MLRRAAVIALFSCISVNALAANIKWEVANRYRLFRLTEQFRAIAKVFYDLPEADRASHPALALETRLEALAVQKQLDKVLGNPAFVAKYGWTFALLGQGTCFQLGNFGHWPCKKEIGDEFLEPKQFDFIASVANLDHAASDKPRSWNVDGHFVQALKRIGEIKIPGIKFDHVFSIAVERYAKRALQSLSQNLETFSYG